jgi:phosphatidylserine/phosphatidylglycerophosphate/cardiolipin synthase-like enzyme
MTAFWTMVTHGTALQLMEPSSGVPGGRYQGDPVRWLGVPPATIIYALATGAITAVASGTTNGIPGDSSSPWTLFELSPLPQMAPEAFKDSRLAGGLPVQVVLVRVAKASGPSMDDLCIGGNSMVTAPPAGAALTAFFGLIFQDRVCRDPLTWARAIQAGGNTDQFWTKFVADISALPGSRNLFILDHVGRPLTTGSVSVAIDGGTATEFKFPPLSDGNTGIPVADASVATVTFQSATTPIVAAVGRDDGQFKVSLALSAGEHLAQVLDANLWFAQRDPSVTMLQRWYSGCKVEPIVDGNPYFARLVDDLRKAKGGGAIDLAGWAFVKGSLADNTIDWSLIPGADQKPNDTRLIPLVQELVSARVPMRFLVNQVLQIDSPTLDDFPEFGLLLAALYMSLYPFRAFNLLATDPAGFVVATAAVKTFLLLLQTGVPIDLLKHIAEPSKDAVDALNAITSGLAVWTPYPATIVDNPLVPQPFTIAGNTIDDLHHTGVYHQKFVNIHRSDGSYLTYLGGIDINSDRVDDPFHRAVHPFHDIQARVTGPAVKDMLITFDDRAKQHNTTGTIGIPAGSIDETGSHLVQIGRTYFQPAAAGGGKPLPTAPQGEATIVNTLMAAIAAARDYIYIEEQYFTPSDEYVNQLIEAGDEKRGVKALLITVPYQTDQVYGGIRRADVLSLKALGNAWGTRLYVGSPFRRFLHPTPALTTNLGRMGLVFPMTNSDTTATLEPAAHLPQPPFWCFVGNELMLVTDPIGPPLGKAGSVQAQEVRLVRAGGIDPRWGAQPIAHDLGTPVTAVQLPGIYVHAKAMMIDDVFVAIGSANINRRGFYHDGEIATFAVPQHLKSDPANPARLLRCRLWAEHLGLPPEIGLSLFFDPISAIPYFQNRSWYSGSRWQPLSFFGSQAPTPALDSSDTIGGEILQLSKGLLQQTIKGDVWRSLVDPTTSLEPGPRHDGPEYP